MKRSSTLPPVVYRNASPPVNGSWRGTHFCPQPPSEYTYLPHAKANLARHCRGLSTCITTVVVAALAQGIE